MPCFSIEKRTEIDREDRAQENDRDLYKRVTVSQRAKKSNS